MSTITFKNNLVHTNGSLPVIGSFAPHFSLVQTDLRDLTLTDLYGKKIVLNIFPSLDTPVCATTVRRFNKEAASLENTVVLGISKDLPFAHARFCGENGIDNVKTLSCFRDSEFATKYGILLIDGPLKGLLARAVIVIDMNGKVVYTELVSEITNEPDYEAVLKILKSIKED